MRYKSFDRRGFIARTSTLTSTVFLSNPSKVLGSPAIIRSTKERPVLTEGIQIGDVSEDRAIVWARSDRPARMHVEWDTHPMFRHARQLRGPHQLESSDFTGRVDLTGLPAGEDIYLRILAQGLDNDRTQSEPIYGHFRSAPRRHQDIRFVWSGDTAGQGYGINPDFGGMRLYETMRKRKPHFFLHSGDTVYADGPIEEELTVEDGKTWRNITTPEKSKVAETLNEFRGQYRYNLLDENVRRFNAEVPQIWQWDDHEVTNNWSDSKVLDDRYTVRNVPTLVGRATKAFLEYAPLRLNSSIESERIYRHIPYGPLLDVFVIDLRSYRGPNTFNRQPSPGEDTAFMGRAQIQWLKWALLRSKATWKVIAADMPVGLLVGDGTDSTGRPRWENGANGDGPPLGRELEIKNLLRFIKRARIENTVWLTADVHYCAAHYYDPNQAQFTDFDPFWEFVSGPINAGSFGPNGLDNTFGPQVVFQKAPPAPNLSPLAGYQFFGQVDIDHDNQAMTVGLVDIDGQLLFERTLEPSRSRKRGHR
ncbi:MAG: alkaline phosphatase D family protein [Myxococcales bacterium]|nr:alkaline phosphatase D family protein [Myxococcales bacterium]